MSDGTIEGEGPGTDWSPIHLKLEEARYFLDQLAVHPKYPKIYYFYFSAFLSSSRSLTIHIQKQIVPTRLDGEAIYRLIVFTDLNTPEAKYFIKLRNMTEKEAHPPLSLSILETTYVVGRTRRIVTQRMSKSARSPSSSQFIAIETVLSGHFQMAPSVTPIWYLEDFPGGRIEVIKACEAYWQSLKSFVEVLRSSFEDDST